MGVSKWTRLLAVLSMATSAALISGVADEKKADAPQTSQPPAGAADPFALCVYHEHMKPLVGEWDMVVKMYMGEGESGATESKGVMKRVSIMGGKYLQEDYEGAFMGQPFTGRGMMGYDTIKKKYFSTWIDSAGSGMMMEEGTCDEAGKTFTFSGENLSPMTLSPRKTKTVLVIQDADHHRMESFEVAADGKETKVMEIMAVRRPK